jgi:GTP pyrophosphokinase
LENIYSIVTDHYRPSPSRLETGFLHQNQLDMKPTHTERGTKVDGWKFKFEVSVWMKLPKRYAAHYKYKKGATEESGLDVWLIY